MLFINLLNRREIKSVDDLINLNQFWVLEWFSGQKTKPTTYFAIFNSDNSILLLTCYLMDKSHDC